MNLPNGQSRMYRINSWWEFLKEDVNECLCGSATEWYNTTRNELLFGLNQVQMYSSVVKRN